MGGFFIWLSGASRRILAECPTERPKYFGLGAAILVTGAMAGVSLSFALVNALKVSLRDAIIFAVLWGLAIMMIDRLFVVSMHRQRNPLIYLIQALPRLLMAVVLGLVISTPFVLQIFKPEITNEVQQMQAAEREAYFKGLPSNPVYLTVQRDQAKVDQLAADAATGGPGIDINKDPQLQTLSNQLGQAEGQVTYWTNQLNCELYGGTSGGTKCRPGYGPVGHNDQAEVSTWQNQVTTLNGEIKARTSTLNQQSQAQQNKLMETASSELKTAEQVRDAEQQQLTLQTQNVTSGIKQDTGLLTQLKALDAVTAGNSMLQIARLLLFLLFLLIDIMPVFVKLLINLTPASNYDRILAAEEQMQLRMAENNRAVRQASQRSAAQAEAIGVRYRNDALSAELPEMHEAIIKSRLRVEKEWLRRHEAAQMRNVAQGEGISGNGSLPHVDGRQGSWRPEGEGGSPLRGWWNGGASSAGQPGSHGSASPSTGSNLGGWASSPPMQRGPLWQPPGPRAPEESRWAWLRSLRLPQLPSILRSPRPGRQAPRPESASQTVTQPMPSHQPTPDFSPAPDFSAVPAAPGGGPTRPERPLDFGPAAADPGAGPARPERPAEFGPAAADPGAGPARPERSAEFSPGPTGPDGGPARLGPLADFIPAPADPDGEARQETETRRETWHEFDPMPAPDPRGEGDTDQDGV